MPSGNGQNFANDITLHYRDEENTFTYTQDMFVEEITPHQGVADGGTKIVIVG
jgi:hypothetical protein